MRQVKWDEPFRPGIHLQNGIEIAPSETEE